MRVPSHASVSKYYADKTLKKICGSFCHNVLGFKRTKMHVSFLATFHLTDFREKRKQYDMV